MIVLPSFFSSHPCPSLLVRSSAPLTSVPASTRASRFLVGPAALGCQRLERGKYSIRSRIDVDRRDVAPVDGPRCVEDKQRALGDALAPAVDAVAASHASLGLEV